MNILATIEARKASRIGGLAVISGVLLGAAGPAFSADLPYDYTYRPTYYRYNGECYDCRRPAPIVERVPVPVPVVTRPAVEVAERHWVQRDYFERHYGPSYAEGYSYDAYPGPYHQSYYPGAGYEGYAYEHHRHRCGPRCGGEAWSYAPPVPPPGVPRRKLGYNGGLQYPPVAVAYRHERTPETPDPRYGDPSRPFDYYRPVYEYGYNPSGDYEASPRPPAPVPSSYYGPGYSE